MQIKLECLITQITSNNDNLGFLIQRKGKRNEQKLLHTGKRNDLIVIFEYLHELHIKNFAVILENASTLKFIPRDVINETEYLLTKVKDECVEMKIDNEMGLGSVYLQNTFLIIKYEEKIVLKI